MAASSSFAILGSGPSTGCPWVTCAMSKTNCCAVCAEALSNPASLNNRNNPSGLFSFAHSDGTPRNVLIDVGKTFRDTALKRFRPLGIDKIHAVLLTHPHADAIHGLDDLRDVSPRAVLPVYLTAACFKQVADCFPYLVNTGVAASTFIARIEWRLMTAWTPFAIPEAGGLVVTPFPVDHGAGPAGVCMAFEFGLADPRRDSALVAKVPSDTCTLLTPPHAQAATVQGAGGQHGTGQGPVEPASTLAAPGTTTTEQTHDASTSSEPVPASVPGRDSLPLLDLPPSLDPTLPPLLPATPAAQGAPTRLLYVSDVRALDAPSRAWMRCRPVDVLVLDMLNYLHYSTHFSALQAVNCAADIAPRLCRFIGMNHRIDHALEHGKLQAWGRGGASEGQGEADPRFAAGSWGGAGTDLGLAYDGWSTPLQVACVPGALEAMARDMRSVLASVEAAVASGQAGSTRSGKVTAGVEAAAPCTGALKGAGGTAGSVDIPTSAQTGSSGSSQGQQGVYPNGVPSGGNPAHHGSAHAASGGSGTGVADSGPQYDYQAPAWLAWRDENSPTVQQVLKGWKF